MTRWLVTGAGGMLGRDLAGLLSRGGEPLAALGRRELDITDARAVEDCLAGHEPDVVVNCAAWTAVDAAEEREDEALRVNGGGVANLAAACLRHRARLVQVSTDYVFGGATGPAVPGPAAGQPSATVPGPGGGRGYAEDDPPAPVNAYGRTKLAGEQAALAMPEGGYVVRTAWLYGAHGPNFVQAMIAKARAGSPVAVVDDQRGQPTWALDVAAQIVALVAADARPGVYHATSSGSTTWYGLAREVFRRTGADPGQVRPVTTAAFPRPASRPGCSVLGHRSWARAGLAPIGDWADALGRALPVLTAGLPSVTGAGHRRSDRV